MSTLMWVREQLDEMRKAHLSQGRGRGNSEDWKGRINCRGAEMLETGFQVCKYMGIKHDPGALKWIQLSHLKRKQERPTG